MTKQNKPLDDHNQPEKPVTGLSEQTSEQYEIVMKEIVEFLELRTGEESYLRTRVWHLLYDQET